MQTRPHLAIDLASERRRIKRKFHPGEICQGNICGLPRNRIGVVERIKERSHGPATSVSVISRPSSVAKLSRVKGRMYLP